MKRWDVVGFSGDLASRVEGAALGLGLICTMRGTLAKYPGCVHWHFKRGTAKGVVEVTVWERGEDVEAWVSVQSGRATAEIEGLADKLAGVLSSGGSEGFM